MMNSDHIVKEIKTISDTGAHLSFFGRFVSIEVLNVVIFETNEESFSKFQATKQIDYKLGEFNNQVCWLYCGGAFKISLTDTGEFYIQLDESKEFFLETFDAAEKCLYRNR